MQLHDAIMRYRMRLYSDRQDDLVRDMSEKPSRNDRHLKPCTQPCKHGIQIISVIAVGHPILRKSFQYQRLLFFENGGFVGLKPHLPDPAASHDADTPRK